MHRENLWEKCLANFDNIYDEYDGKWQKRRRKINSKILVIGILKLVWQKENLGYKAILVNLWSLLTAFGVRRTGKPISPSSFFEARLKLDPEIFKDLNRALVRNLQQALKDGAWLDHRIFAIDGTVVNVPAGRFESGSKRRSKKSFVPLALVSCLYDLESKISLDFSFSSDMNERSSAEQHINTLRNVDVVVLDRGYFSYAMANLFKGSGIEAVFRLRTSRNTPVIQNFIDESGRMDKTVTYFPQPKELVWTIKQRYPKMCIVPIELRIIKAVIKGKLWVFATTLVDRNKYSRKNILELYKKRWRIEELFKSCKVNINFEEFYAKNEIGVKQEVYAAFLITTISRLFSNEARKIVNKKITKNALPKGEELHINFRASLAFVSQKIENLLHGPAMTVINTVNTL